MYAYATLHLIARWPGIYAVVCPPARLCYVGQTRRAMAIRWTEHFSLLQLGRHPNDAMQAAYKAHGRTAFDVAVLEIVSDMRLIDAREQFWIRRIGSANERR